MQGQPALKEIFRGLCVNSSYFSCVGLIALSSKIRLILQAISAGRATSRVLDNETRMQDINTQKLVHCKMLVSFLLSL